MKSLFAIRLSAAFALAAFVSDASADEFDPASLQVPEGYVVELAARPPLVEYPMMAALDDQGRLFVAANSGENLPRAELEKRTPNFVQRLEDVDGDGVFDKATRFADNLTFPQGCLWHDGALFVASSGAIWKFVDTNDDGVADQREKLVGDFGYTGNAADIHGPFLGPEGRIYWCDGRHGHEISDKSGKVISKGKAARIFSCRTDGSDLQTFCSGGMDNPVEVVFTPEGEMLGTVNLLHGRPRGDSLVHWQYGGVYPRIDYAESLDHEFVRTGDLLSDVVNFGHVAVSGLCRLEGDQWGASNRGALFITQFNTNRVVRVQLRQSGSSYEAETSEDFLVSENHDFHPTDVLQDKDGSLLVIDTGGWFRIGCPQSEVSKPDVRGAIYRIRRVDSPDTGPDAFDPKQRELASTQAKIWSLRRQETGAAFEQLKRYLSDERSTVRQTAIRALLDWPDPPATSSLVDVMIQRVQEGEPAERRVAAWALAHWSALDAEQIPAILATLTSEGIDQNERHALVLALIRSGQREELSKARFSADENVHRAAEIALQQLRRLVASPESRTWLEIPPASLGVKLTDLQRQRLVDLAKRLPAGDAAIGKTLFSDARVACDKCHRVQEAGGMVGPDLSTIGRSRSRTDLLESILYPSATFARDFAPYSILTDDGRAVSGIILGEGADHVKLGIDRQTAVTIQIDEIEAIKAGTVSIMPADITAQISDAELAHLLAYLESLLVQRQVGLRR